RSALAPLGFDASRDPAARPPLRPPARDADAGGPRSAAGEGELAPDHARVGVRGGAGDRARAGRGRVLRTQVNAPEGRLRATWRLASLAAVLVAFLVLFAVTGSLSPHRVRDWIDGYGVAGPLVFIVVSSLLTVVLFPGPLLSGASGLLFGTALGTPVSIVAATTGATLALSLSRWIAHDAVEQVASPRVRRLRAWIGRRGFFAVLYARLAPGVPYSLVNYAAG